ncbi:MAG: ABC transporter ATP-binding protein [Phycisphaeraceae bacterium]|nr:ABC transporter ATP-binding protein [Phycisphaeraceae bacterium]MDP7346619.1 ABC transporter ATP-binding protein [Phycisphaeraceae bacterium]
MTALDAQPTMAADSADDVVQCTGVTKVFRDFWMRPRVRAVDGLEMSVRRGQVFGLLGPNGSGKSTTIKMILGLLRPTGGFIRVMGKRPEDVSVKRHIGYLPEESYLYRFLNARETLDFYGRLFKLDVTQRKRRIDMLLHMVGLEAVARRPVGEYSKGMQRRIGLAQALINDPELLILDEPTTGLDPIGTRQIKDLIVGLAQRGKTILLCSHLLADVEDVCDRVAIMFGGRIRKEDDIDGLLTQQGLTNIQTDKLDEETIAQIDQLLTARGNRIERVEHPRQKLESLFLEIVHEAQATGVATDGARSDGRIADFLVEQSARDAHLPEGLQTHQLIDELVSGPRPSEPAPDQRAPEPAPPAREQVDDSVIDSLVEPSESNNKAQ